MIFSVTDAGAIGIIRDVPGYELPPNAWTAGQNVRIQDGSVHKAKGYTTFTSPPEQDPYFVYPVQAPTTYYWIYLGLAKAFATRGIYHYDITRASGDYTGTTSDRWTGTNLGGVRVFNNGVDLPQYWQFPTSHVNALQNLANWPSTYRCKTMRAYKNYLVATNVTKASTVYPNLVKWSHGADIGAIPTSWDETDPTLDAGEYPLPYGGGVIDQLGMRDFNILYCDDTTWGMQYIGGAAIFRFWPIFETLGLLAPNCAAEFFGSHFIVTPDDVGIHDGQQFKSVADKRVRHTLFHGPLGFAMGSAYYSNAFVLHNRPEKEMWVCYSGLNDTLSTTALVWSYSDDVWSQRDLPGLVGGAVGIIDPLAGPDGLGTWNGWTAGSWASASGSWNVSSTATTGRGFDGRAIGLVGAAPGSGSLFGFVRLDSTALYGFAQMTSYVERTGSVLDDPSRRQRYKVTAIYPHIEGTLGGTVYVYVAYQDAIGNTALIDWGSPRLFTLGTDYKVDIKNVDGRFIALKFVSTTGIEWHLKGYDIDYEISGTK